MQVENQPKELEWMKTWQRWTVRSSAFECDMEDVINKFIKNKKEKEEEAVAATPRPRKDWFSRVFDTPTKLLVH